MFQNYASQMDRNVSTFKRADRDAERTPPQDWPGTSNRTPVVRPLKAFAGEGASVFITGRRQETLDAALKAIGGRVTGVQGDMGTLADIDRLYDAVQQHVQIDEAPR
jgi:hypothetical protein